MTSRTPIRLTPYRGPLATPSASPESSPTLSTPPTDISHCSTTIRSTLDVAILQHRISTLSPLMQHQHASRLYHQRQQLIELLFGHSTHLSPLSLVFENLLYSAGQLAKTLVGIVTFCLFIWGLLEWSSYASELPRQSSAWKSMSQFPLPSTTRALRCHMNPSLCEPSEQHVAVLQFVSEHIQHAKHLSSLSAALGLPFRAFLETHRETIPRAGHNLLEPPHFVQEVDTLVNLTKFLDSSLLDFTSGSFIGRSFTLALEELGDLISEPIVSRTSLTRGDDQDVHLHAIYWRTASNLLLAYSAARPRARRVLQDLHVLHQQLSPLISGDRVARSFEGRLNTRWRKGIIRHPTTSIEDGVQTFVAGLEVTLDNVHRLSAYLDWVTEQLAQSTLQDVLKTRHRTNFSSCMISLRELFAQSTPLTSKKHCFCLNDYGFVPLVRPERVEIVVPGSPTVRADR